MGNTGIPYVTKGWNPIVGCVPPIISEGCINCWARKLHNQRYLARKDGYKLLEACKDLLEQVERWNKGEPVVFGDAFEKGCLAVAKAEGK